MSSIFKRSLLVLSLLHLAAFLALCVVQLRAAGNFVLADGVSPIGGDFVNLWTAGRMVLEGQTDQIYLPARFMELQQERVGGHIGYRLWAYPPRSLALAVPFGLPGYLLGLAAWSLLGLAVLAYGARRLGMNGWMVAILLLSPASLQCVYWGQTGNLACGLLLLALSQRGARDGVAIGATTLLTIKPQFGFLLPVLWLMSRRWGLIAAVSAAVLAVAAASLALGGWQLWRDYLFETLPKLGELERHGTGPFVNMIPSMFMGLRIVTGDGDLAANLHLMLAAPLLCVCLWLMWRDPRPDARMAALLLATAALTPYLHVYDLSLVVAGVLVMMRLREASGAAPSFWMERAMVAAWALPYVTLGFNAFGVPLAPLVILGLLALLAANTGKAQQAAVRAS